MTATIVQHDQDAGASPNRYHYTRIVEIAGRTVRARVERDHSLAVVEVFTDEISWTRLADAPAPGGTPPRTRIPTSRPPLSSVRWPTGSYAVPPTSSPHLRPH